MTHGPTAGFSSAGRALFVYSACTGFADAGTRPHARYPDLAWRKQCNAE